MSDVLNTMAAEVQQNSLLELAAVVLAIAYLLLAVRQHIACWYAAFISTAIFLHVFWSVQLYMESALQVYYLVMAVYGWWHWQQHQDAGTQLPVSVWSWQQHAIAIVLILSATAISGYLLQETSQRLAYVDSFTTWGAIVTTVMVARKVLENWIYWLVIDAVSIYLYLDRDLYFTALLFMAYLVIVIFGFRSWLQAYRSNDNDKDKDKDGENQPAVAG
ncbi:MAG: nicotinamide riboside transporter PnuC [Proteobacteria bacterium]|nr:nicotinamide riboside transporter PnuC [Pseudomonadota bacterium]